MTGETDLARLLTSLSPVLVEGEFIFCSCRDAVYGDHRELEPFATCVEPEGLTFVIPTSRADEREIAYESTFRAITLKVHSSLEAVGLTACVATKLTAYGISANVIAGFYHDHIFVQSEHANKAMTALAELAGE